MNKRVKVNLSILTIFILIIILGVYILTKANPIENNNFEWIKNIRIAHRGIHDNLNIPENSLKAFSESINKNVAIELDVQLTKDNKVVVFHDDDMERLTGKKGKIKDFTYKELLDLKLLDTEETIPMLSDVLTLVNEKVPILIEVKNEGKVGELEERVYEIVKKYKGKIAIQAFNPFVLEWFYKNAKEIPRGQISGSINESNMPFYQKFILRNLLLNFKSKPNFISYEIEYLPNFIVSIQRKMGVPIIAWTVKGINVEELKNKCDNIIFEE